MRLLIEVIEYASFEYSYFWNYSSFIRCSNCERFCFFMQYKWVCIPITTLALSGIVKFFSGNKVTPPPPQFVRRLVYFSQSKLNLGHCNKFKNTPGFPVLTSLHFTYCRFDQLIEYGQKMVASNPRVKQLRERVTALKQEKVALKDTWSERNDVLHEGQDLQVSRSIIN